MAVDSIVIGNIIISIIFLIFSYYVAFSKRFHHLIFRIRSTSKLDGGTGGGGGGGDHYTHSSYYDDLDSKNNKQKAAFWTLMGICIIVILTIISITAGWNFTFDRTINFGLTIWGFIFGIYLLYSQDETQKKNNEALLELMNSNDRLSEEEISELIKKILLKK